MRRKGSIIGDLFNMDVLFGILLGMALPFIFLIAIHFEEIKAWQDLIAGVLAVIGAIGAVGVVIHQIRETQRMEDERRERQMYAARAMAPHALTSLCDYAERCCSDLRGILGDSTLPKAGDAVLISEAFEWPELPKTSMEPLQLLLQFGDHEIQNAIATLIQFLQVQQSRIKIRHIGTNQTFGYQYYSRIVEAVEIYARAASLFDYSRGTTEAADAEPNKPGMVSAATHCGFWHPKWDPIRDFIDKNWHPYSPTSHQQVDSS